MLLDTMLPWSAPPRRARPAHAPGVEWPPAARAVMALAPGGCRWPLGDVANDNFRFCNAARRLRGSYCDRHAALATVGVAR